MADPTAAHDVERALEAQKTLVRECKAQGKSKEEVDGAVAKLLELKAEFEKLGSPASPASGQKVDPWTVENIVDYELLIKDFGSKRLGQDLLDRMQKLTNKRLHTWLRRDIFFSHRDFNKVLDAYEQKKPFYLYTGRGPSSMAMHLGHLLPFMFCQYLQATFDVPIVIQLTDDEKFLWKEEKLEEYAKYAKENIKDIIACGFDMKKTYIFSDMDHIQAMYPNILRIQKCVTFSQARGIFGFEGSTNIGKVSFPAIQAAPSFASSFPTVLKGMKKDTLCLIPCAIDQDPYFRMTRDVAPRLRYSKPTLIHSKFFPALQGSSTKMSASKNESAIFLTDTPKQIKTKINKYAFSGGGETIEEHREKGGNCDTDISYQYLTFFLDDDEKLEQIRQDYSSGKMLSGEIKKELIEVLQKLVKNHQEARAKVDDETIAKFTEQRTLEL